MTKTLDVVKAFVATWSEPDPAARRRLLELCRSGDTTHTNPRDHVQGREALLEYIDRWQEQNKGARIVLTSGVHEHHGFVRFTWALKAPDGSTLAEGTDFGEVAPDGRLGKTVAFVGPPPKLE